MNREIIDLSILDDELQLVPTTKPGEFTGYIGTSTIDCTIPKSNEPDINLSFDDKVVTINRNNLNIDIDDKQTGMKIEKGEKYTKLQCDAPDYSTVWRESSFSFIPMDDENIKEIVRLFRHCNYISNLFVADRLPLLLETGQFKRLVDHEQISEKQNDRVNSYGFVYTKCISSKKAGEELNFNVCCIYGSERSFEQHSKPLAIEVEVVNKTKTEVSPVRELIYTLDAKGNYQNVTASLKHDEINRYTTSPLDFNVLMDYLRQLNLSILPSTEFEQLYNYSIPERVASNFNKVRSNVEEALYIDALSKEFQEKLDKKREELSKKFPINSESKKY